MSILDGKEAICLIGRNGYVTTADVQSMRQGIFKDGIVSKEELAMLLGLAERAPDGDPEWPAFFGEAAGDYYLREEIPHDYITEREFTELRHSVTQYGKTVTPLVLSMIVKLMHDATATPPMMADFVCDQIKQTIKGRKGDPVISAIDVELIRKFLYAMGGDGNIAVTQKEATLLFDLNDMTLCAGNDPSWSELFVKAIANHLMGHIGYRAPTREEALQQWQRASDHSVDVGRFFDKMVKGGLASLRELYARDDGTREQASGNIYDDVLKTRTRMTQKSENITQSEADWLADRIGRDGVLDDNERAIIAYMRELEAELPAKLKELIAKAA